MQKLETAVLEMCSKPSLTALCTALLWWPCRWGGGWLTRK